jgi:hypothetical protein
MTARARFVARIADGLHEWERLVLLDPDNQPRGSAFNSMSETLQEFGLLDNDFERTGLGHEVAALLESRRAD